MGLMVGMGLMNPNKSRSSQSGVTARPSEEPLRPAQSPTDRQLSPILTVYVIEIPSRLPISRKGT